MVALQGDSGKPRPAVVIQADWFDALSTVVVLPLTSSLQDAAVTRIDVAPTDQNGLKVPSQIGSTSADSTPPEARPEQRPARQ